MKHRAWVRSGASFACGSMYHTSEHKWDKLDDPRHIPKADDARLAFECLSQKNLRRVHQGAKNGPERTHVNAQSISIAGVVEVVREAGHLDADILVEPRQLGRDHPMQDVLGKKQLV